VKLLVKQWLLIGMTNCLDAAIVTALGVADNFCSSIGLQDDYFTTLYDTLRTFLSPYVHYPLGLIGLDIHYVIWLSCVLAPFIFIIILPLITFTLFYCCICVVNFIKYKHEFSEIGHQRCWKKAGRLICAIMWRTLGRLWHGYEVRGLDKLPNDPEKPAMLVYYHGEVPLDCYYLMAELVLRKHDKTKSVADRFLFRIPGWKNMLESFNVIKGSREECQSALKEGYFLVLAPGGTREMLYSDANYEVYWGSRLGYAKIALHCNVPIYPVVTRNIREVFRFVRWRPFWKWQLQLYEKFKFPFVLMYGGFPSKLITYIGDPINIHTTGEIEAKDLDNLVQNTMTSIIDRVQPKPGKILRAISERFLTVDVH